MQVVTVANLVANIKCRRSGKTFLFNFLKKCETHDAIIIPENTTNGDVIKAVFPNVIIKESEDVVHLRYKTVNSDPLFFVQVSKKWWDAPYKGESEET